MGTGAERVATRISSGETGGCFLPDLCDARVLFVAVLVAELLAFLFALAASGRGADFWGDLAFASMFVQWVTLVSAGSLCLLRARLARLSTRAAALIAFGLALLVTALCSLAAVAAVHSGLVPMGPDTRWGGEFVLRNLAMAAIVMAVALRYFYVQHQWKQNVEAQARAQIQALQARIRPHFLFNSMNTIASLTRTRPEQAERAIEDLADVFRATLEQRDRVTLAQELEIARRYLNIEALRLGARLKLSWQMADDVPMQASLPALTLQPLVENAIYHGIEPRTEGGEVVIAARREGSELVLEVENPLPEQRRRGSNGNRMAQENIRERLALAYAGRARMEIDHTQTRYTVRLRLPLELS